MILSPEFDQIDFLLKGSGESIGLLKAREPYSRIVCEFLNDLSIELRTLKDIKEYPDILTFSFWCRRANIKLLRDRFQDQKVRMGRGTVFHITPSNLPVNFAFSFAFGLLSGNSNIVRVPSRKFRQIELICQAIERLFSLEKYTEIKATNMFLQYARNQAITGELSMNCDVRLIWGGDTAVKEIRELPIRPHCIEMVFVDRYSFCVLNSTAINVLSDDLLDKLALDFYNDAYLMDQEACSSPHLIVWIGEVGESREAKEKFWRAVAKIVEKKYLFDLVHAVDKYTQLCNDAIALDIISGITRYNNQLYCISLDRIPNDMENMRGKYGYFYEFETDDIHSIAHAVTKKFQTLTYFGMDKSNLGKFVINSGFQGIDRIAPVGKALDIGVIWDGYDVIGNLSRIIDVQ